MRVRNRAQQHKAQQHRATVGILALTLGFLSLFQCSGTHAVDHIRTVALSGDPAPGTNSTFGSNFAIPVLNNQGEVAFSLTRLSFFSTVGNWSEGGGENLRLVLLSTEAASGTEAGTRFRSFSSSLRGSWPYLILNDQGLTTFPATLTGASIDKKNNLGLWREQANHEITLVARAGNVAPGTEPAVNFFRFLDSRLNSRGQAAFRGAINPQQVGDGYGSSEDGIWLETINGDFAPVAIEGSQAPGTTVGVKFRGFNRLSLNNRGQTAFVGGLNSTTYKSGIWREEIDNGLTLVVRAGDPAPGVPLNLKFSNFFHSSNGDGNALPFNASGKVAIIGELSGPGIHSANDSGIWSEGMSSGLRLVAREGDEAPAVLPGTKFDYFHDLLMNDRGQTAFHGGALGPPSENPGLRLRTGIWREELNGELAMVALSGEPAPGTDDKFGDFGNFGDRDFALNNRGQMAFLANLVFGGSSNGAGIWAEDTAGTLQLIALVGGQLDVSDDSSQPDLRTISELSFIGSSNRAGEPSGFNEKGQLAFRAIFTDRSVGIFVSNLVAVPEPSTLGLLGVMGYVRFLRRQDLGR